MQFQEYGKASNEDCVLRPSEVYIGRTQILSHDSDNSKCTAISPQFSNARIRSFWRLSCFELPVGCDSILGLESEDPGWFPLSASQSADTILVEPDLKGTLQTPDTVSTGDAFEVRTGVENQTAQLVAVPTGNAALWKFGIYDGDELVPVKGAMLLCATVVTEHTIEPGENTRSRDLRAGRSSNEDQPIDPGTYTARLTLDWKINGTTVEGHARNHDCLSRGLIPVGEVDDDGTGDEAKDWHLHRCSL